MASAASTCTLDETTHRATVIDGSGTAPLRIVSSNKFIDVQDGSGPLIGCDGTTTFAKVNNTDRVNVLGSSSGGSDGYISPTRPWASSDPAARPRPTGTPRSRSR